MFRFFRSMLSLYGRTAAADHSSLRPQRDVRSSLHEGGVVLFHTRRGVVFSSNRAGAMIWAGLMQGSFTLDGAAESICQEFHVPLATAQADTRAFVAQLETAGLLVRSGR